MAEARLDLGLFAEYRAATVDELLTALHHLRTAGKYLQGMSAPELSRQCRDVELEMTTLLESAALTGYFNKTEEQC